MYRTQIVKHQPHSSHFRNVPSSPSSEIPPVETCLGITADGHLCLTFSTELETVASWVTKGYANKQTRFNQAACSEAQDVSLQHVSAPTPFSRSGEKGSSGGEVREG
jgi:hypothetical protein